MTLVRGDQEVGDTKETPSKAEKDNTEKDKLGGTSHRLENLSGFCD